MSPGQVIAIFTCPAARQPRIAREAVRAVPGKGLEGDRFFNPAGAPGQGDPGRQITLVEVEALEALKRDHGIEMAPIETRRNVVTRGVRLNDLLGHEFLVGEVRLRGVDLCHPCSHLEAMTRPGVLRGMVDRGGLVAEILSEGTIRVGDTIE